jgi:AsmA protein
LFPRIGADLGQIAISESNGSKVFASTEHARISVALIPLFFKQFVVDRVLVDGLVVNLHHHKDGTTNYDDLLPKATTSATAPTAPGPDKAQAVQFDLAGIAMTNASLNLTDDAKSTKLSITKLNLSTGPIANGKKSQFELSAEVKDDKPKLALSASVKSKFTPDLDQQRYTLDDFSATVTGAAMDFSNLQLKLSAHSFEASPKAFKTPALSLQASLGQGTQVITAKLGSALSGDLDSKAYELNGLSIDLALPNPAGGTMALSAKGKASVNLAHEVLHAALTGKLDTTSFDAKLGLTKFAQPAYSFDIALGDLDADRYMAKSTQPAAKAAAASGPEPTIDLSALQSLDAKGSLKVASLKIANIRASNNRLELLAKGGKAELNPLSATLYGGNLSGALSASHSQPPRMTAKATLGNIQIGPLLKDAIDKQPVDGKGNVVLDLSASGATVTQLKKGLNGTASFALKDGAINGINLAAALRKAKLMSSQGAAEAQEKTDFTELSGSFKISNGVAHNDDLSAKTPLFRLGGNGDINIGSSSLDYTAKATVVPTLQGQGGPELQELKGLTVPVILSGPFSAIQWRVDLASMANNRAKELVEERKKQLSDEMQRKLDAQKEQLQDRLKGLLRR